MIQCRFFVFNDNRFKHNQDLLVMSGSLTVNSDFCRSMVMSRLQMSRYRWLRFLSPTFVEFSGQERRRTRLLTLIYSPLDCTWICSGFISENSLCLMAFSTSTCSEQGSTMFLCGSVSLKLISSFSLLSCRIWSRKK